MYCTLVNLDTSVCVKIRIPICPENLTQIVNGQLVCRTTAGKNILLIIKFCRMIRSINLSNDYNYQSVNQNRLTSHSITAIPPVLKKSTGNPSSPGALPDFISFPASITCSNDCSFIAFDIALPTPASGNF